MAVTTVTTTMAGAINYTVVTDTSADWPSVANSTYFYDKVTKLVYFKNSGGTVLEIFSAAGGLTEFTEAETTAAPNATVAVNSLTPVTATTDADFAIRPKGTGAIIAAIPDNTITGGNKRGAGAVDLQTSRILANQVAAGQYAVIAGGQNNRANGSFSLAAGNENIAGGGYSVSLGGFNTANGTVAVTLGESNTSSGNNSSTLGRINTASGADSAAIGRSNTASATSAIAIGNSNTASGTNACAIGGMSNIANGYGSYAFGVNASTFGIEARQARGSRNTVQGDCQKSEFYLSVRTTGNTATTITVFGGAAGTGNQVILSNNAAYGFTGTIIGKQSGSTNAVMWKVEGLIARGANAASTVLTTSTVTLVSNAPAWGTPTLAADTTNGGLRVQVVGAVATNIQWTAVIETTEVIYA